CALLPPPPRSTPSPYTTLFRSIFKATQEGDLATVRNLQKLMLRSWSNTPGQRAAGDAAQRLPQDGRGQWAGRVDLPGQDGVGGRSEEHTSELQSRENLVCRLLL